MLTKPSIRGFLLYSILSNTNAVSAIIQSRPAPIPNILALRWLRSRVCYLGINIPELCLCLAAFLHFGCACYGVWTVVDSSSPSSRVHCVRVITRSARTLVKAQTKGLFDTAKDWP